MDKLLGIRTLCDLLGIGRSTVYAWLNSSKDFPQPIVIGNRTIRWRGASTMNKAHFLLIANHLSSRDVVPTWLPDGNRQGHEWIARNPTRDDKNPGSFSINLNTGAWSDFATGDKGGELVSLYAYLFHANDNGRAAYDLAAQYGIEFDAEMREEPAKTQNSNPSAPEVVMPAPEEAKKPNFSHHKYGNPSTVWP